MTTEPQTALQSSLSGNASSGTETIPELEEARLKVATAIEGFKAAGNEFLAAGGNPMDLMGMFQAAMV
jgi:biotin operon repressor